MNDKQRDVARRCLDGAYDNTMTFPEGVHALLEAGFDGYLVDYRLNTRTYYLTDGETLIMRDPHGPRPVDDRFNVSEVATAIRWAQENPPGYSYAAFGDKVAAGGCAGYLVSFPGRRVLYFGRTGETHTEHFPQP